MTRVRAFFSRLRGMFGKARSDSELNGELQAHLDFLIEENIRRGMSPEEARYAARREFGGLEQTKEQYREQRGLPFLETLLQDVRYGLRMLAKSPGFTVVVVLTLALGIGANSTIFSVMEAVLLRPLPYPNADQLAMVWEDVHLPQYQNAQNTPAPGNYADWKAQNDVFTDMAAYDYRSWSLIGTGQPVRIVGDGVTSNLFSVLQVNPVLGRVFSPEEDRPGGPHVAVLSYALWKERFGGDPRILGRAILLDEIPYTVVGVMPAGYRFPAPDDQLWVPIAFTPEQLGNHGSHYLHVIARLKPGVTIAEAQSAMAIIARRLTAQHPDSNAGVDIRVVSLRTQVSGEFRQPLLVLSGVVGFLLLMVCANVANLQLSRASTRTRELAIRSTLGASRERLVLQLLAESLLLALIGGGLGLAFAYSGLDAIRHYASSDQMVWYGSVGQSLATVQINGRVSAFTFGVSLVAGLIFGLLPAFQSSSREVVTELREGARESASGARLRIRALLVVAEVTLGVVVLIGAGLLLRSFVRLQQISLGFQPERVLTLRVIPRGAPYTTLPQRAAFYRQALERIQALPGVRGVAAISFLPLTLQGRTTGISIEGTAPPAPGQVPFADFRSVSPGYFAAMEIPLLRGRDFTWDDASQSSLVVIISQTMAHNFWPGGDAIGKHIKLGAPDEHAPWITVVGIVGDVRQLELTGLPRPAMYFAVAQDAGTGDTLRDWVIRASGDPSALASAVRSAIWAIDPNLPVSRVQTMEQIHSAALGPQQFNFSLVGLFGVLALILAAVGLYGVTAYSVAQRRREIGIRIALGAQPSDVLRLVVGQVTKLVLLGLVIGTLAALILTRLLASLLYATSTHDPLSFAGVATLLLLVAAIASYIPARRATRVDPMVALRYE